MLSKRCPRVGRFCAPRNAHRRCVIAPKKACFARRWPRHLPVSGRQFDIIKRRPIAPNPKIHRPRAAVHIFKGEIRHDPPRTVAQIERCGILPGESKEFGRGLIHGLGLLAVGRRCAAAESATIAFLRGQMVVHHAARSIWEYLLTLPVFLACRLWVVPLRPAWSHGGLFFCFTRPQCLTDLPPCAGRRQIDDGIMSDNP